MSQPSLLDEVYCSAYGREVEPYPFQRTLAEDPGVGVLIAPTGLGKTAGVTLGWICRRLAKPADTPRRLVWCLPMRTLVEQTARQADTWMQRLAQLFAQRNQDVPTVHVLMGGSVSSEWRLHPERPTILVGTQDMLLSRALMRGYGMSRFGWPIDFGLLHTDALWVFDEVQLMGAGLATSAQVEAFRRRNGWRVERPAKSLWISATLQPEWLATADFRRIVGQPRTLRWNDGNPSERPNLSARLDARKAVRRAETMLSAEQERKPELYAKALAGEVLGVHRGGQTTLVILNTVRRAQLLYAALVKGGRDKQSLLLLHSRFRRPERSHLEDRLRNERTSDRIIVATQAVEAGVDMTSSVLFTELAPWSSLVQRFGRCNREGELNDKGGAEIRWIDIELEESCARPYDIETLAAAHETVAALTNAAPRTLPGALPPRAPKQVIRAGDFEQLFDTDADLSGYDLDISPYIRDTNDTALSLFWREIDGEERVVISRPASDELCSAPLSKELDSWLRSRRDGKPPPVFVEDPNGRSRKRRSRTGWILLDKEQQRLRPGMVLMLDSSMGGYDPELGFVGPQSSAAVDPIEPPPANLLSDVDVGETTDDDLLTEDYPLTVELERHLRHVEALARKIAEKVALGHAADVLARAARWHDVGKAYAPFQGRLGRTPNGPLLAKSKNIRSSEKDQQERYYIPRPKGLRRYFRHELASALTFLDQHDGEPEADLTAFLIAAHHGKVRMGISALPEETRESPQKRIARGVQDGDELPEVRCGQEVSAAGILDLGLMEMGEDESGRPSWAARMQAVLGQLGPFRLAYLESLLRMADWRASIAERSGKLDDE